MLKALEEEFDNGHLYVPNSDATVFNAGRRDVIVYIRQMIKYTEKNDE